MSYYSTTSELDTPPQPRFLLHESADERDDIMGVGDDGPPNNGTNNTAEDDDVDGASEEGEEEEDEEEEEEEEVTDDGTAQAGQVPGQSGVPQQNLLVIPAVPNLDALYGLREIGREALCWQLSSAKPGNGVEQIRDHSTETYWQSDGTAQPHWIQVHFARRVAISHVCLYLDYNLDESYTPRRLTVSAGMTNHDLVPAILPQSTLVEFQEPVGWCIIPLQKMPDPLEDGPEDPEDEEEDEGEKDLAKDVVKAHLVQISILSQHQNGRDTHVRQVQLYGPRTNSAAALRKVRAQGIDENQAATTSSKAVSNGTTTAGHSDRLLLQRGRHWDEEFSTLAMSQFSTLR